jgi:hypothetical protein
MSDFNPFQRHLINQHIPNPDALGIWQEEGMLEFFGSGDRLWLIGNEIQVIKYGDGEIPVQVNNQEFYMAPRTEYSYPSTQFATALAHFLR